MSTVPRRAFWVPPLLAVAAYLNSLPNAFVWDDLHAIVRNPWIRTPAALANAFTQHVAGFEPGFQTSYYRPLMYVLYAACFGIFGLRPWGFRLLDIGLHAATSALVYVLARRFAPMSMRGRAADGAALIAAALFAVHPIHADAVAFLGAICDLSFAVLSLTALVILTGERRNGTASRLVGTACYFLALLAKEPAIMTWPVLATVSWSRGDFRSERRRGAFGTMALLGVATLAYSAMRVHALHGLTGGDVRIHLPFLATAETVAALFGRYVGTLILPMRLSAIHDVPIPRSLSDPRVFLGIAIAVALAAAFRRFRGHPEIVLGLSLVVFPLLPCLYVAGLSESLFADRYLYLPSAGAAILLAAALRPLLSRSRSWRAVVTVAAAVTIVTACGLTVARNRVWRDSVSLWSDTVEKYPASAAAHEYLGSARLLAGDAALAVAELERALELNPARVDARINLASAQCVLERPDDALRNVDLVLASHPGQAEAHAIAGDALSRKGDFDDARRAFSRALELDPRLAAAEFGLGLTYAATGPRDLAAQHLREAMRLEPDNPRYARALDAVTGR